MLWILAIVIPVGLYALYLLYRLISKPVVDYKGKHCLVTGGSKGLGKSLAISLAKKGAHVTILARNQNDLEIACEEIKAAAICESQRINFIKCDVIDPQQCVDAVHKAYKITDVVPSMIFACAGISLPSLFVDQELREFKQTMDLNYTGTVNVIHVYLSTLCVYVQPAVRLMIENKVEGKVVLISSVLGLFGLIGYTSYCPTKFALREALRQELMHHKIGVHIMYPATIFTPGFDEEQKRKPEITKIIEGADEGKTSEAIAKSLLSGIDYGDFFVSSDIIGELLRCLCAGTAAANEPISDALKALIAFPVFSGWSLFLAITIKNYFKRNK